MELESLYCLFWSFLLFFGFVGRIVLWFRVLDDGGLFLLFFVGICFIIVILFVLELLFCRLRFCSWLVRFCWEDWILLGGLFIGVLGVCGVLLGVRGIEGWLWEMRGWRFWVKVLDVWFWLGLLGLVWWDCSLLFSIGLLWEGEVDFEYFNFAIFLILGIDIRSRRIFFFFDLLLRFICIIFLKLIM